MAALAGLALLGAGAGGCAQHAITTEPGTVESVSEIAEAAIGGLMSVGESAPTGATNCPSLASGGVCAPTGSQVAVTSTYRGCEFARETSDTWTGSELLLFANATSCPVTVPSQIVTRTFGAGTQVKVAGIVTVTLDTVTAPTSGWDSSVTGVGNGSTVIYGALFNTNGSKTMTISGLHATATTTTSTVQNQPRWNYTISSAGLSVSVQRGDVSSGGVVVVQDNTNKLTGRAKITTDLIYGELTNTGCCHPTSGTITTTLSGSQTGTQTIVFGPACGAAQLTDSVGRSQSLTLNYCF